MPDNIWSAPGERSGGGALDSLATRLYRKRCRARLATTVQTVGAGIGRYCCGMCILRVIHGLGTRATQ
ncbi:MAG: hypothetical protein ACR2IB_05610 [Pyrinomonadaceae bacterium]